MMSMGFGDRIELTQEEKRFLRDALLRPNKEALQKRDALVNEYKTYNYQRVGFCGFSASIPENKFKRPICSIWNEQLDEFTERKSSIDYVTTWTYNMYIEGNVDDTVNVKCEVLSSVNSIDSRKYQEEHNDANAYSVLAA